jgi:hypothetical protein
MIPVSARDVSRGEVAASRGKCRWVIAEEEGMSDQQVRRDLGKQLRGWMFGFDRQ